MVGLCSLTAFCVATANVAGAITIVASPGPFGTVEKAAVSEAEVNWWDADPADDDAATESFAATELAHFLAVCTGVKPDEIHFASPDRIPATGDVFLLGSLRSNPLIAGLGSAAEKLRVSPVAESYHIRAFSESGRTITVIAGHDRAGTLYGVYAYLEQLGMRFYGLGELGTIRPDTAAKCPRELDITGRPDYATRGFWAPKGRGDRTFFEWMVRNRLNLWTAADPQVVPLLKKFGMRLTAGGHVTHSLCLNPHNPYPYNHARFEGDESKPADPYKPSSDFQGDANRDGTLSYFEAHPEWYGLIDGKRSDKVGSTHGDNYCTSNPDATAELAGNFVTQCIEGEWKNADIVNFWMLDGCRWCSCEACQKQGTPTDRVLAVTAEVLQAVQAARKQGRLNREILVATLAYHDTIAPPTKPLPEGFDYDHCTVIYFPIRRCYAHPLADPACTEVNELLVEQFKGWASGPGRHYRGSMFIGEYYNVSLIWSMPVVYTRIMAADIPWYYRNDARHFHYMHTPTRLWGTWTLNQYLMARLLWNVDTDVRQLLDEYFAGCYPTTTERTRRFYEHLEYAGANIKAFKHNVIRRDGTPYTLYQALHDSNAEIFPMEHMHYEPHRPVLNDGPDVVEIVEAMNQARREVDDALLECRDPRERLRLMEDERRFAYGEAMVRFYYHMIRVGLFQRKNDPEQACREFVQVERQAEILRGVGDLIRVTGLSDKTKTGLDATNALSVYEVYKKRYGQTQPARE